MDVLLVSPVFLPHRSGAVTLVCRLAESLKEEGHNVEILAAYPRRSGTSLYKGIRVRHAFSISPGTTYAFSPTLVATLRKRRFDVVHAFDYQSFPCHFIALSKFIFHSEIPFCFSPQYHPIGGTAFRSGMRSVLKYFANFVFQQSDKIICLSNHERLSMLENLDVQKEKIDVVPLGLDLDDKRIPAARQRTGSLRLLYVGRLERYKGVQLILWALSRLEEKDVELSVVGYGTFADELRRLANRLDLGRRVTFLGRIDDTKL
nr:glycosyltransferase family 4 protein [Candidatus Njordarchaeum guaymaensis]